MTLTTTRAITTALIALNKTSFLAWDTSCPFADSVWRGSVDSLSVAETLRDSVGNVY